MNREIDVLDRILAYVVKLAKFHLEKRGEFFPFGVILRNDDELQSFNFYEGEDRPDPKEYLNQLEEILKTSFEKYDYNSFGIGVNAAININGNAHDAILIKLNFEGRGYENSYLPYEILEDKTVKYYDLETDDSLGYSSQT